MAIEIDLHRDLKHADGSIERFEPARNRYGQYILADTSVREQGNLKENQVYVDCDEAVAARLKQGWSIRMKSVTGRTSGTSLIAGSNVIQTVRK